MSHLKIRSNRQYRSYVIAWFLLIAGVIVGTGGVAIYKSAEAALLERFKSDRLSQITAMASLIDAGQHARLTQPETQNNPFFSRLASSFKLAARGNGSSPQVFSLNIDRQSGQFNYAVDPTQLVNDAILITTEQLEIIITSSPSGEPMLWRAGKFSRTLSFGEATQAITAQLIKNGKTWQLLLNAQPVLSLTFSPALVGKHKDFQLSRHTRKSQISKVKWLKKELKLHYRFVKKGELVHPPGTPFIDPFLADKQTKSLMQNGGVFFDAKSAQVELSGIYFVAPIKKNQSKNQSVLLIKVSQMSLLKMEEKLFASMLLSFSFLAIFLMTAAIFFARKITQPLDQLTQAITRLINNDFNFKLSTKGFGSFAFLANQFNLMLTRLQTSRSELILLNKSYSRFVPHQLLKQLSSSGVNDIALGDSCERQMTVMFCDIRGFTSLSESMSPASNFRFINRYLAQIAPVINKHGGIIDKYMGDGIMALFPKGADAALSASIGMLEALEKYNETLLQKNLPAIQVGLGLHSGKTMLGTVGTPARMDATVVSDTVNAAARVESMTKVFKAKILITEETKQQLKNLTLYKIRYMASCQIRGKSKPVTLYEVFNTDPVSVQKEKSQNQSVMIRAWSAYKSGDSALAVQLYQRLIEKSPNDKSVMALIECCQSGRL